MTNINNEGYISRRGLLRGALGVAGLGAFVAASQATRRVDAGPNDPDPVQTAWAQVTATARALETPTSTATSTPEPTRTATLTPNAEAKLSTAVADIADLRKQLDALKPTATPTEVPFKDVGGIRVYGVPEKPQGTVDMARGEFKKSTDVLPFLLADPGGLLVGPDFVDTTAKGNPYGSNPGASEVYKSEGSIHFWDPVTEEVLRWSPEAYQNLPEGGFVTLSLGQGRIEIPRDANATDPAMKSFVLDLPYQKGNNYIVVVRGLYADNKQDSDLNRTMKISRYKAGHAWVAMYQSRFKSNLGFVSEDQLMQQVATSHAGGTDCGAEGCSKLTLVGLDQNTGAAEVYVQTMTQAEAQAALADWKLARKGWKKESSNLQ